MYLELCAHNIFVSYLLSLCWVHVFYVFLYLTLPHKKSSLRSSVTQTADGNKQGAEPPGHPYHLVGLKGTSDGRNSLVDGETQTYESYYDEIANILAKFVEEQKFSRAQDIKCHRDYKRKL